MPARSVSHIQFPAPAMKFSALTLSLVSAVPSKRDVAAFVPAFGRRPDPAILKKAGMPDTAVAETMAKALKGEPFTVASYRTKGKGVAVAV